PQQLVAELRGPEWTVKVGPPVDAGRGVVDTVYRDPMWSVHSAEGGRQRPVEQAPGKGPRAVHQPLGAAPGDDRVECRRIGDVRQRCTVGPRVTQLRAIAG